MRALVVLLLLVSSACGASDAPPGTPGPDAAAPAGPDASTLPPPPRLGAQLWPNGDLVVRVASTRATRLEVWLYDAPLDTPGRLHNDSGHGFADQTGVGASTNARSELVRDLAIDSLRYWHETLGVDGFRFDLAPVLANKSFATRLIAFRRAHAALRPASWQDGATLAWYGAGGAPIGGAIMDDPAQQFLAWRVDGAATNDPARSNYVVYNGGAALVKATLPAPRAGTAWVRIADTDAWLEPQANFEEHTMAGRSYDVHARSLAIFEER
jgi:pullulanase/glycogen debranching enzyme